MAATYPADTFQEGVDLTIEASNQIAQVVRGDANTEVMVADGSTIPSIRKAQTDSMYFKEPEAWTTGQTETDYLQLKKYISPTTNKESWWFAKGATVSSPIAMGTSPFGDDNWTLYTPEDLFISGKAEYESVYQALKGKAAEAGYNLIRGSFEEGGTLTNTNDVLWYQANGKYYSWAGTLPKVVAAGATPATSGGIGAGAWVDRTDDALRDEITPSLIEALRRSYAEDGFTLVSGSFEEGGILTISSDVLLHKASGKAYSWTGAYPVGGYVVAPGTNPALPGSGYVPRTDSTLKSALYHRKTTVSEIESGVFTQSNTATGTRVYVKERNDIFIFNVGGSPNGFDILDAGNGNTFSLYIADEVNLVSLGASTSSDISAVWQRGLDLAASTTPRRSVYLPNGGGSYFFATPITWRTQVSFRGDGKQNTSIRWVGDDATWAIHAESGGCYDLSMKDFSLSGVEFTATAKLLNHRKFRYSTVENVILSDCLVCLITGDSWDNLYINNQFVPRISSPNESHTGCVGVWVEDGTLVSNATTFIHNRFQFCEVGLLVKSGGRNYSVTGGNIFESCGTGIRISHQFVRNFVVTDNYFEFLEFGPVWLEVTGMIGWMNGLTMSDNYIICNASEFGVIKISGTATTNRGSVVIENNAVEFNAVDNEPTSGVFLYTPNGTSRINITYNQRHIVNPFNNTETYRHYDPDVINLPTFSTNVPFQLHYANDDQGNPFSALYAGAEMTAYTDNGVIYIHGTARSPTQVGTGLQKIASIPASAATGTSYTTAFTAVRGESTPQLTQRLGTDILVANIDSGNVAHVDFSFKMQQDYIILNSNG